MYPFLAITSKDQCQCLPGYYAQYNDDQVLVQCIECGLNSHRNALMNATKCVPCPTGPPPYVYTHTHALCADFFDTYTGMMTPTATSANCYCIPGTYQNSEDNSCVLCQADSYCPGGFTMAQCPLNSHSAAGSVSRGDCHCDPGYYGNLADPTFSACMPLPLAYICDGECTCASGWEPVYNLSADGTTLTMHCISQCNLGEYAKINSKTFAKVLFFACVDICMMP